GRLPPVRDVVRGAGPAALIRGVLRGVLRDRAQVDTCPKGLEVNARNPSARLGVLGSPALSPARSRPVGLRLQHTACEAGRQVSCSVQAVLYNASDALASSISLSGE